MTNQKPADVTGTAPKDNKTEQDVTEKPAAGPREFWIVGPDDDSPSIHHINPGFKDQVHVIEKSAYNQLAEQLERYKGMWESECERGNRHLDKLMLAEKELEQARKERDELTQCLADYEHETLTVKEALAEKMKAIGEYGLMMQQRDEAIRQADALANMIESLFCNPEGRASFEGSQGDKIFLIRGLKNSKPGGGGGDSGV